MAGEPKDYLIIGGRYQMYGVKLLSSWDIEYKHKIALSDLFTLLLGTVQDIIHYNEGYSLKN